MIYQSILDTVGHTPVIEVTRLTPFCLAKVYLKLESFNPTASIKDRSAVFMIRQAERMKLLRPGSTIIESTSGNFGKSLALVGAASGYSVVVVIDPKVSQSTIAFIKALGARIEIVTEADEEGGFQHARIRRVQDLLHVIPDAYWPNQYGNPNNPRAHEETTGLELLTDFERLDTIVASVSTGGHITGVARAVRKCFPNVEIVAVDAVGSAIFSATYTPYLMNGIGLGWRPDNLDISLIDEFRLVSDREAFSAGRLLAKSEGILAGGSGGAVLATCLSLARSSSVERIIVGIIPDSGTNYLEQFYDDEWLEQHDLSPLKDLEA